MCITIGVSTYYYNNFLINDRICEFVIKTLTNMTCVYTLTEYPTNCILSFMAKRYLTKDGKTRYANPSEMLCQTDSAGKRIHTFSPGYEKQEIGYADRLNVFYFFFQICTMFNIKGIEFDVLMYIYDRTIGWGKVAEYISISNFSNGLNSDEINGCIYKSGSKLSIAINSLIKKGVISRKIEDQEYNPRYYYALNLTLYVFKDYLVDTLAKYKWSLNKTLTEKEAKSLAKEEIRGYRLSIKEDLKQNKYYKKNIFLLDVLASFIRRKEVTFKRASRLEVALYLFIDTLLFNRVLVARSFSEIARGNKRDGVYLIRPCSYTARTIGRALRENEHLFGGLNTVKTYATYAPDYTPWSTEKNVNKFVYNQTKSFIEALKDAPRTVRCKFLMTIDCEAVLGWHGSSRCYEAELESYINVSNGVKEFCAQRHGIELDLDLIAA